MKRVEIFRTSAGKEPFSDWLSEFDSVPRGRIYAYVRRVARGGAKKSVKPVGHGVFEIKVDHGPGYRVYFSNIDDKTILLLLGGDKSSQFKDIHQAIRIWKEYAAIRKME